MSKFLCQILILTLLSTTSQAQKNKGVINAQLGFSLPDGDYASKNPDKEEAGFAKTGANFDLSYSRLIEEKKFGYSFTLRAQTNPIDVKTIADIISDSSPLYDVTVKSERFEVVSLLVGGFYSMSLTEKTFLNLQFKMGLSNSKSPARELIIENYADYLWIKQESASATSFAYLLGTTLNYSLSSKLYLLSTFEYFVTKPEFSNIETISSDENLGKLTFDQSITTFNLGLGIGFKL